MTATTHILQRPAQFQWDRDSAPCQSTNCNCTSTAMIAGFYKDTHVSPMAARRAMQGGSSRCGGTNVQEAVKGLSVLGVPATWEWASPTKLRRLLNMNIPVNISVNYGKIPNHRAYITDFNFNGPHSVTACKVATGKDHRGRTVPGILVRDPDHGSPARPERPNWTFWPDWVWIPAWVALSPSRRYGLAVYPRYAKKVAATPPPSPTYPYGSTSYAHVIEVLYDDLRIRSAPNVTSAVLGHYNKGARVTVALITESAGKYPSGSTTRDDWYGIRQSNGTYRWIARAYTKLIK
jgi:Bacterial SH3 domain/Papain-like cysteine protease AvrRpt2